jgi:ribosomal protein L32
MKRSHHVCPSCGYYGGRQAVELKKKGGEAAS